MIALVVTIIVLLILAAVAINLTIGENGIFTRAQDATKQWDKASVEEDLGIVLAEYPMYKLQGGTDSLEDYLLSKGADSATNNGDGTIEVEYKGYVFTIDEDSLEIISSEELGGVKPEIEISKQLSSDQKTVTITVTVTNNIGTVDSIELTVPNGNKIEGNLNGKTATFIVNNNGEYTAKVKATTDGKQRSTSGKIEVTEIVVEFSTKFGRIEVIWIDQGNKVIDQPLSPEGSLMGMTPVKWEGTTESTAKSDNSDGWYNYVAGTGTEDNLNSHWANAKDGDNYFVWIPRYAYRITYYADQNSDVATGYYDGRGMVDTQGNVKYELDAGIETVENNGKTYIVHPAFMNDTESTYSHGGWTGDLAGIWVGKYETSGSSSDMKIIPNAKPIIKQTIGTFYNYAFNYDRDKESHLMKNSEWGAVAYLTHSQYGRNGNEIYINNGDQTGNSGGSTDASLSGAKYAYNTPEGQKASSTGNMYGIYDLSGGNLEYLAAFDNASTSTNINNGNTFASTNGPSTQYATAYINGTNANYGTIIYEAGKIGDATKEVFIEDGDNWNGDRPVILTFREPFFLRGGLSGSGSEAGVFSSNGNYGSGSSAYSFRVVLGGAAL